MSQIEQSLVAILSEIAGSRPRSSVATGSVLRDYGLDSLESVQLMAKLEERYGVIFGSEPEDMDALESLSRLAGWVAQRAPGHV